MRRGDVSTARCVPAVGFALCALVLTCSTGCPVVRNLPAPATIITQREPDLNRRYHLYVPTTYTPARKWPLVVTCHGTNPFDTASLQLQEWKGLAEQRGFIAVAPELVGTSAAVGISPPAQVARQLGDEQAILSVVRTLKAAYRIDEACIFLTGWSAGGYAVLFTGLRHPDTFRALAVRQGNFNPAFVEPCAPFIDPHQPVMVMYGDIDPLKEDAIAAVDWLKSKGIRPDRVARAGAHRREPDPVYGFFADCVRHRPWIRVQVQDDPDDPMTLSFSARCSFDPGKYLWDFGDRQRSPVATPQHRFTSPGQYTVKIAVYGTSGKPYVRQIVVQVPRVRLGARPTATAAAP